MRVQLVVLLGWLSVAHAAPPVEPERPWAVGVSDAKQKQAFVVFKAANALFVESRHTDALARYREALAEWDHPSIRYNMAVCLVHLDQPLAAYDNLTLAMRFGPAALGPELWAQAQTYKKLLDGQLARVRVRASEPQAEVFLDGDRLFVAPGEVERLVMPGHHQLLAKKPGFLPDSAALVLLPGHVEVLTVHLLPLSSATKTVRRYAVWKPWAVFGAGLAVAAIGGGVLAAAQASYHDFDALVKAQCPAGCVAGPARDLVHTAQARGDLERGFGIAAVGAGGVAALVAVGLLIANQPRIVASDRVAVTPVLSPSQLGFLVSVRM